jgi:hypothetical protein
MGTPAWQKREYERQQLLESLMREAYDLEETVPHKDHDSAGLLLVLASEILRIKTHAARRCNRHTEAFVVGRVIPVLRDFARSKAEFSALFARFLEKHVLPAALNPIFSELQREELHEPKKIFLTERSTDEVEL